jgi:hypothetical protein
LQHKTQILKKRRCDGRKNPQFHFGTLPDFAGNNQQIFDTITVLINGFLGPVGMGNRILAIHCEFAHDLTITAEMIAIIHRQKPIPLGRKQTGQRVPRHAGICMMHRMKVIVQKEEGQ